MKSLVTALLVVLIGTSSVIAEDYTDKLMRELYSHLNDGGFTVKISLGADDSLTSALTSSVELRLRSAGLPVTDSLTNNAVICHGMVLPLSYAQNSLTSVNCRLTICVFCAANLKPHCLAPIDEQFEIAIVPNNTLRSELRNTVSEQIDLIANKILKYRPDLRQK